MTRLRIVCTNPNGSVAIVTPAAECLEEFRLGLVLARTLRGIATSPDREREFAKLIRDASWRPDRKQRERERIAREWFDGLFAGGLSERQAVELIRDHDAPAWSTGWEIVHQDELPADRRHRNAWRRSPNGGPIYIDEAAARRVDAERAAQAAVLGRSQADFENEVQFFLQVEETQ
jgi:hypothetical protein